MPAYLILPFAAALGYTIGSMLVKRGLQEGASVRQAFHLGNLVVAVVFLPLLFFQRAPVQWQWWPAPAAAGLTFYVGALFNTVAIRRGDVSLVNPILGTKVVFVALVVSIFGGSVLPPPVWAGTILAAAGVLVMGGRAFLKSTGHPTHHVLPSIALALASAAAFALTDVLVAAWAPRFGRMAFVVLMTVGVALASTFLNPLVLRGGDPSRRSLRRIPRGAAPWIAGGSVVIALQALLMALALSGFDDPTGVNIAYSSRGLWSVALTGVAARAFGVADAASGPGADGRRVFGWRLAGAILLTSGIVLAVAGIAGS